MKTLLAGNGINIQFGGKAYTSQFIIERMKCRATIRKYDVLFENTVSSDELNGLFNGFVNLVNRILLGEYDDLNMDTDVVTALKDFKSRYTEVTYPHDIMLEDWFFVLKMYTLIYKEDAKVANDVEVGFKRLFLDAIYNDGNIQNLYQKMGKKVCRFFKKYDEIYTVNYDSNLENATSKPVYHLHGDFTELQPSENPEYILGYQKGKNSESVIIPSFEHSFCNALLSYSGDLKYKEAKLMHQANISLDTISLPQLLSITQEDVRRMIILHTLHPELKIAPEYHFDRFESISGELDVIGMSPNNDQHIIQMIKKNPNITVVNFFCHSSDEEEAVRNSGDVRFHALDVKKLWSDLGVEHPKKYGFKFPKNFMEPLGAICILSDYQATEEKIKEDITSLPPYEITRICDEVFEELKKHDAIHSHPKDFSEFKRNFAYISHIATKEGILPPSLLALIIMNFDRFKNGE